jgi:hypothetical protein
VAQNPDKYSATIVGNIENGQLLNSSSTGFTIRWYPDNIPLYITDLFVYGNVQIKVTNLCPNGKERILEFKPIIDGFSEEI